MIALIDYGSGNIRSVYKALQHEGAPVQLVSDPAELARARAVVLPGVGAFADCAAGIRERGLWEPLQAWLQAGKAFLGICVGYQLLFESSAESADQGDADAPGFGFFRGHVRRFAPATQTGLKVPQIGWNALEIATETESAHPLFKGLPERPHVYFVHSYFPAPVAEEEIIARAEYGERFAAACARGRVMGTQFHPEKSQAIGLKILRNFLENV